MQEHFRDRIDMFTADGAANEQLAARLLHPGSSRSNCQKLPNLSMILRDKAHATRRLTERTFQADPNLDRIMQAVVTGETSVARLLKNSRLFQCIFEQEVCKQVRSGSAAGVQGSVRDMSFAKQRFDSTAKPHRPLPAEPGCCHQHDGHHMPTAPNYLERTPGRTRLPHAHQ